MEANFIVGVMNNIALLLALGLLYSVCTRQWDMKTLKGKILAGFLFGGVAMIGMLLPLKYSPGITFDGRTILVGLVGLFCGPVSAAVAVLMTGGLRIWQGGIGQWAGLATIFTAALIGVIAHKRLDRNNLLVYFGFGLTVHLAMLCCMLILPDSLRWRVLSDITMPVLLVYPISTMLYARLIIELEDRNTVENSLRRRAEIQAVLREIAEATILAANLDELFHKVHRLIDRVLPANLFHINLLDEATNEIVVPYNSDSISSIPARRPVGGGITEYIINHGHAIYISPDEQDRLIDLGIYKLAKVQKVQRRHYLGAPLIDSTGRAFGTMALIVMEGGEKFESEDKEILSIIAAQVSMAIERKLAAEKLHLSEAKFSKIFNTSVIAMALVHQKKQDFFEVNEAFMSLTGYSREEIIGKTPLDMAFFSSEAEQNCIMMELKQKDNIRNKELRIYTQKGSVRTVIISIEPIEFVDQSCWVIAAMDITERKQLQNQIATEVGLAGVIQSAMLPGDFDCDVSEIRTVFQPIHGVSGDFFAYKITPDQGRLQGYVLDVTGHGMAAALQTTAISVLLNRMLEGSRDLSIDLLEQLNQESIPYFFEGTYAAIILFDFDFARGVLRCASGGINRYLVRSLAFRGHVTLPGSFVGLIDRPEFNLHCTKFQPGDEFYFITDGIGELLEPNFLMKNAGFEDVVGELKKLASSNTRWDDCAGICVRIKPKQVLN